MGAGGGSIETEAAQHAGYGRNFWLLFWSTFALNSSANLFVLYPLELVSFGAGATVIGAIIGIWSLASLASRPAAGPLIDRFGRRSTAAWLLGIDIFVILLYLPIRGLGWHIYAVRMVHGAIEGTARVALFALLYDMLPKGREGRAMATFSLCGMGPAAFAPYCGEVLIRKFGFGAFLVAIFAVTAAAAIAAAMLPSDAPSHGASRAKAGPAEGYARLVFDSRLMPLWVVTLLFSLSISPRLSFVAPFAYERGITQVGTYFAIYAVIGMAVRIFTGRLMDRFGLERTLAPSMAVLAVGMGLIALTGHFAMLDIAGAVGGLGHGYLYPALSALVIARTDVAAMGRSASIYQSLYDVGTMVGPYALGAIAGVAGYGPMFVIAGALSLAGALYFAAADRESH
ncbi:MAG: MFS transporter [Candidatus Binataceae bacterium]